MKKFLNLRGFDVLVLEGDARLLAWLATGAGLPAAAYSTYVLDDLNGDDNSINSVSTSPERASCVGDTVFVGEATGDRYSKGTLRDMFLWMGGQYDWFETERTPLWLARQIGKFDPLSFVPPALPDVSEYTFVVSQQNGRISPAWETWQALFGKNAVHWAEGYNIRKTLAITVGQPRLLELFTAAHQLHEAFPLWYAETFGKDPVSRLVLTGILPDTASQELVTQIISQHRGIDLSPLKDDAGYAVTRDKARVDVFPPSARIKKGVIAIKEPELTSNQARQYAAVLLAAADFLDGFARGNK